MNKLRDFIYNVSDVILALVIITLIAGIIGWKIKAISDYPQYAASLPSNSEETPGTETPDTETPDIEPPDTETPDIEPPDTETPDTETPDTETPDTETPDTETPENEPDTPDPDTSNPPAPPQMVTVRIPDGSIGSSIAKILLENNLIQSSSEFLNRATERKLDSKLRSGTFKIPSNATLDEVINILTGQ